MNIQWVVFHEKKAALPTYLAGQEVEVSRYERIGTLAAPDRPSAEAQAQRLFRVRPLLIRSQLSVSEDDSFWDVHRYQRPV